ncbi:hypothetical protein DRO56_03740, partial [Candidatus Bathyarchaeota archaeon]
MSYLMGVDIGTQGTKSALVDLEGRIISSAYEGYGVLSPHPGWAEQWPEIWFEAVCKTIRSTLAQSKVDPREVAGLCISGLYGGSGIPLDQEMRALRPCIIWADRRASEECDWVREKIGVEEIFRVTGNIIDPYYGYVKMLWIKPRESGIWARIRPLVTPYAYCIYRLTGELSIDYSSAGNYGGIFDIHRRTWSEEMMDALGIRRDLFPERISLAKEVVGEVSREGERLTGLSEGTPV